MKYTRPILKVNNKIKNYCANGSAATIVVEGGWLSLSATGALLDTNMCSPGSKDSYGPIAGLCQTGAEVATIPDDQTTVTDACDTGNSAS